MRLLYAIPIILLPNTTHLPPDVSVGASVVVLLLLMLLREPEPPLLARSGFLTPPLVALFFAMLFGFLAAQWHDLSNVAKDLREAKSAVLFPLLYVAYRKCGLDMKGTRQLIVLLMLVAVGAVEEAYVDSMLEREQSVSTHMGNGLAIPHGTNEGKSAIRRTAISFVRYPGGVDWKGKEAKFVVGIAGAGNDHLELLGRLGRVFVDKERVAELEAATSVADVRRVLGDVGAAAAR